MTIIFKGDVRLTGYGLRDTERLGHARYRACPNSGFVSLAFSKSKEYLLGLARVSRLATTGAGQSDACSF
jgi:hypothetical protein